MRTTEYLLNLKHMGSEPDFSKSREVELSDNEYAKALTWYNSVCSKDDARAYTFDYLTSIGRTSEANKLSKVPDAWFPLHVGWIARLAMRGAKLRQRTYQAFEERLAAAFAKIPNHVSDVKLDRNVERASDVLADIEKMVDMRGYKDRFSLHSYMQSKQIPLAAAAHIGAFFKRVAAELVEVIASSDNSELRYAYRNVTTKELQERLQFYTALLRDCEKFISGAKALRPPRKKRTINIQNKLKRFKYLQKCERSGLQSLDPAKIFASDELWTFNTKYKVLTVLRAAEGSNLSVAGTSFKGYNEVQSKSYRLGRKPEKYLNAVLRDSKRNIARLVSDLKEAPLAHRSGENTVLVRAF